MLERPAHGPVVLGMGITVPLARLNLLMLMDLFRVELPRGVTMVELVYLERIWLLKLVVPAIYIFLFDCIVN